MEPIEEEEESIQQEESIVQDKYDDLIEDDLENYIISDMPCVIFVMPN